MRLQWRTVFMHANMLIDIIHMHMSYVYAIYIDVFVCIGHDACDSSCQLDDCQRRHLQVSLQPQRVVAAFYCMLARFGVTGPPS